MRIVPRSSIIIRDRQRKNILAATVNEMKESIFNRGLLQPPVCYEVAGDSGSIQYLLIAGETRIRAMDSLAEEERLFSCDRQPIGPGEIPILLCDLATLLQQKEAEFEENVVRSELSWQERAQALADIHELRKSSNPEQTQKQTAIELSSKGGIGTAKSPNRVKTLIRESVLIAPYLSDPTIANARNPNEARQLILKKEEEAANAILAKRTISKLPTKPDLEIRHADLESTLPQLDGNNFDLILADPPYGIGAGGGGFRSRTVHHHNYVDDLETARRIAISILTEGFRICKSRANLFLFTDIRHWDFLQLAAARIGWAPFPRPIIWGKSDSEGLAPWGASGPRITTEFIFFATKGQKGLLASPIDYQRVNRVPRHERIHAAEKPVELIRKLLECSTLPGDRVLDPCCGSGSTIVACKEMNRKALGLEKSEDYYRTAMSNLYGETKNAQV